MATVTIYGASDDLLKLKSLVRTAGTASKRTYMIEDGAFFFVLQMGRECEYMPNILRQILAEAFG